MLSTPSKYALRALQHLAAEGSEEFIPVEVLAENTDIPAAYLSKIMKTLAHYGMVESRRGIHGGVRFTAVGCSFFEVCEVLDDPIVRDSCLLGNRKCGAGNTYCEKHLQWSKQRDRIHNFLKQMKV